MKDSGAHVAFSNLESARIRYDDEIWVPPRDIVIPRPLLAEHGERPLVRVSYMEAATRGVLDVFGQRTTYAHHLATRRERGLSRSANPLHAAVVAITEDKRAVLGFTVKKPHWVEMIGDFVDPDRDEGPISRVSPGQTVLRAMEEFGIPEPKDLYSDLYPELVVERGNLHPTVVHMAYLDAEWGDVRESFQKRLREVREKGELPRYGRLHDIEFDPKAFDHDMGFTNYSPKSLAVMRYLREHPEFLG